MFCRLQLLLLLLLVRPVQAPAVHLLQPLPHLGAMLCRVLAQLPDQVLEMLLGRLPARVSQVWWRVLHLLWLLPTWSLLLPLSVIAL